MSVRKISVAVGVLFIVQMISAMIGTMLTKGFLDGNSDKAALNTGVLLMVVSGLAVVGIGLLAYRVLKPFNQKLAVWYPIMRVVECLVSVGCGVYLLANLHEVPNALVWVYVPTAIGGVIFTYLLLTSGIVPKFVAWTGLVGYALFGAGTVLHLAGLVDINAGSGQAFLAIGGVFELLLLPAWLLIKGFKVSKTMAPALVA
jgi:hypothetical protein